MNITHNGVTWSVDIIRRPAGDYGYEARNGETVIRHTFLDDVIAHIKGNA